MVYMILVSEWCLCVGVCVTLLLLETLWPIVFIIPENSLYRKPPANQTMVVKSNGYYDNEKKNIHIFHL